MKFATYPLAAAWLLAFMLAAFTSSAGERLKTQPERPVLGVEHKGAVKLVLQITNDEMKKGVGKGLVSLKAIHQAYIEAGVAPENIRIHAVYHGKGADHMLTDSAWNRWKKETGGNPNTRLITELTKLGISIELCDSRRLSNGWAKEDVHPDVILVRNAYGRLADLQLQGYAYVKL